MKSSYKTYIFAAAFFLCFHGAGRAYLHANPQIYIEQFRSADGSNAHIGRGISAQLAYYFNLLEKVDVMPESRMKQYSRLALSNDPDFRQNELYRSCGISAVIRGTYEIKNSSIEIRPEIYFVDADKKRRTVRVNGSRDKCGALIFKAFTDAALTLHSNGIQVAEKNGSASKIFNSLSPLFQPDYNVFDSFSRGVEIEDDDTNTAYWIYKRAQRDSFYYFTLNDRVFYTYFFPYNAYRYKSLYKDINLYERQRNIILPDDMVNFAVMLSGLADSLKDSGYPAAALTIYEYSNRYLVRTKRTFSIHYAENLASIGEAAAMTGSHIRAHSSYTLALDHAESHDNTNPLFNARCRLGLANSIAAMGNHDISLKHYRSAMNKLAGIRSSSSLLSAALNGNLALTRFHMGAYEESAASSSAAYQVLVSLGLDHSAMAADLIGIIAAARFSSGEFESAVNILKTNAVLLNLIGSTRSVIYSETLHNTAAAYKSMKNHAQADRYYRMAAASARSIGNKAALNMAASKSGTLRVSREAFHLNSLPSYSPLGLSLDEDRQLSTYTGVFSFNRHSQKVKSRTYSGRHDDTNIFLKDLLSNDGEPAMKVLRPLFLNGSHDSKGKNLYFIDIGPAIANEKNPGITAVTLSEDFPSMQVIGIDLPDQVEIFLKKINPVKRADVKARKNLHILSGDGILPLKRQLQYGDWAWKDREAPSINKKSPVVIRMANSIEIYFSWKVNRKVLDVIADDFETNPVIIFFNRSILFKPQGSKKYRIIGYVSVRGFWHNDESFDRLGEPPYTLIDRNDIPGK